MAGLLADVLPALFGGADSVKKRVKGLLSDPRAFMGNLNEDAKTAQDQRSAAFFRDYGLEAPGGLLSQSDPSFVDRQAGQGRQQLMDMAMLGPIAFHGSPRKFGAFDLSAPKTTGGALNKHGVSVSPSERVAERYASDFSGGKGYVYKVDADYKKPLNLSAREFDKLQKTVGKIDRGEKLTESESIDVEILLKKAGIGFKDGDHPISNIRSAGFDAVNGAAHPYGAEAETLVFDPALIKILESRGRGR